MLLCWKKGNHKVIKRKDMVLNNIQVIQTKASYRSEILSRTASPVAHTNSLARFLSSQCVYYNIARTIVISSI